MKNKIKNNSDWYKRYLQTKIDVVIIKQNKCLVKSMTIEESRIMKKHKEFEYKFFQIGFHTYKSNI